MRTNEANQTKMITLNLALAAAILCLATATIAFADEPVSIDLAFITHLDANMPEQDVYIERIQGSGEVWRVTAGDHNMNALLYKTAVEVHHDPFDAEAVGPYEKGEPLGMTLGDWLKHSGTGRYTCTGSEGRIEMDFKGLVPNGVYTVWHAFISIPPPVPFTGTLDIPLGARDGSESIFKADRNGNAKFVHDFVPCLQMSDIWTTSMVAINYHSDGRTYGGSPGSFGNKSHIPLFTMLPKRAGLE